MSIRLQDATAGGYAAGSYDGGADEPPPWPVQMTGRTRQQCQCERPMDNGEGVCIKCARHIER